MSRKSLKKPVDIVNPALNIPLQQEDKKSIQLFILKMTEGKLNEPFSNERIQREDEKIKLLSGVEVSLKEQYQLLEDSWQPYVPMFTKDTEFFPQYFKLKGWPIADADKYTKPPCVGRDINSLIYSRISKEFPTILQSINPYVEGTNYRRYKHFQRLTAEVRKFIESCIRDAVRVMKQSTDFYDFKQRYCKEFKGIPFQLDAFEDNSKVS